MLSAIFRRTPFNTLATIEIDAIVADDSAIRKGGWKAKYVYGVGTKLKNESIFMPVVDVYRAFFRFIFFSTIND